MFEKENWYVDPIENEITQEEIKQRGESGSFYSWKFKPFLELEATGYEDLYPLFDKYTVEKFQAAPPEVKKTMIDEIYQIYRERDIFPIKYYSDIGIQSEIERCVAYKADFGVPSGSRFDGEVVSCGVGIGTSLCNYMFPNIYLTPSKHDILKGNPPSAIDKFHSEKFLKKAINFAFSYKEGSPYPSHVMGGLRLVGSAPSNFRPMNAQAIYERFCPPGGVIFDFCAGFGGRMLGALTSKNKYKYVATDPCVETMYHLQELGEAIEDVTGRENSYELHCCGSEDFTGKPNSIDFAFSSPPYFDLEQYSTDETQCYIKYPELDQWLEGFVRKTIKNLRYMLKPGAVYACDIADFDIRNSDPVHYVDKWRSISEEEGFKVMPMVYLGVTARAGTLLQDMGELKKENILIFKKV